MNFWIFISLNLDDIKTPNQAETKREIINGGGGNDGNMRANQSKHNSSCVDLST